MMSKVRVFLRYWLPVCLWMVVIFRASGDSGSFSHSSRIIGPLVRFFFPGISDAGLHDVIFAVRKGAHLTEYAILAVLLYRAIGRDRWTKSPGSVRTIFRVLLVVALYAASDEWHQSFVPNREASVVDVLIDTVGGGAALSLVWAATRAKQRRT
jgi:VanZ family protein